MTGAEQARGMLCHARDLPTTVVPQGRSRTERAGWVRMAVAETSGSDVARQGFPIEGSLVDDDGFRVSMAHPSR